MSSAAREGGARVKVKYFVSLVAQSQTLVETNPFLLLNPISYETVLENQKCNLLA